MRTVLRHRLKRVRCCEQANGDGLIPRVAASVIAGSVETLVVHARERREPL